MVRKYCPRPEQEAIDALVGIIHAASPAISADELRLAINQAWQVR